MRITGWHIYIKGEFQNWPNNRGIIGWDANEVWGKKFDTVEEFMEFWIHKFPQDGTVLIFTVEEE